MWRVGATLHRGARASHSRGLSCCRSTGSRRAGSVVVAHRLSCSAAFGIFPDQGPNPCPLHWQADSQPLRHQGTPLLKLKKKLFYFIYFWLRWVLIAARGLSLVVVLLLRSTSVGSSVGFSSCGSWALELRLSSCGAQAQLLCGM